MIRIQEVIEVKRPIDTVYDYLRHFENIRYWDPSVRSAHAHGLKPPQVGSRFDLRLSYWGKSIPLCYEITRLSPPTELRLRTVGDSFTAVDTILLSESADGTRIRYRLDLSFSGWRRFLEPALKPLAARIGRSAIEGLKAELDLRRARVRFLDRLADRSIFLGLWQFTRLGYGWASRAWKPFDEDLRGRTVVVTGATSGIGRAAVLRLSAMGARLAIVARNAAKAKALKEEIARQNGNPDMVCYIADLSRLKEIRELAQAILANEQRIDVLVNNAGALFTKRQRTAEGFEFTLATDLLGPFLLTTLLMPKLRASAAGRIINVSSGGMYTRKLQVDNLDSHRPPYNGSEAYARAKRALVIISELWADRLRREGVVVNSMHPGWVNTPGLAKALPSFHRRLRPLLRTPEQGADTLVWLAAADEAARSSGLFWLDRRPRVTHVFPGTRETAAERDRLWTQLNDMTGDR
jgi:NAD(P)-dependent dehydrogenase (short-subunit alcohol dehydrogenase family)